MLKAIVGGKVLLGEGFSDAVTLLVEDGIIRAVLDESDALPSQCTLVDVSGQYLVPGFIDTQVNGGGGVLFNDEPTLQGIRTLAATHRRYGTTGLLPTLISDDLQVIERAQNAVRAAIEAGVPGILGLHLEGPFLASARRGIHNPKRFRALDAAAVALLSRPTGGRTVVTLAPECADPQWIKALVANNVIVALGHSDATAAETLSAFDAGVTGVTHLFNAMSPLLARAPGVVGACLLDPRPWCGLIVDGHHVDPLTLRVALAARPHARCMLVSDAMSCVGSTQTSFLLDGRTIHVTDGVCRAEDGTLAGSAADMLRCVRTAARSLHLPLATVFRMASEYPADFLGLSATHGRIAPGYRADLLAVSASLDAVQVID